MLNHTQQQHTMKATVNNFMLNKHTHTYQYAIQMVISEATIVNCPISIEEQYVNNCINGYLVPYVRTF